MKGCVLCNMFKIQNYLSFLPLENVKINEYPISSIGQKCINIQYNDKVFLFENTVTSYKFSYCLLTSNYFRLKRELNNNQQTYYYLPYIHNYNKKQQCNTEILFRGNDTYASLKKVQNDLNLQTLASDSIKYVKRCEYNAFLEAENIVIPWVDTPTIPLYQILLQSLACGYVKRNIYDLTHSDKSAAFNELYEIIDLLHIKTTVNNNYLYCNLNIYDINLFNKILNFQHSSYWNNILNGTVDVYDNLTEFIQKEVNV